MNLNLFLLYLGFGLALALIVIMMDFIIYYLNERYGEKKWGIYMIGV